MKLKKYFLPLMVLVVLGCNSDDTNDTLLPEPEPSISNFVVIGQDLENVYQYDFDGTSELGQLVNLTQELNITTDFLTLRELDDLLSFYYFRDGAFSLITRDVQTGLSENYSDFFANSPGRSVAWGINSESNVFFGFFGPTGTRNLGIQNVDLQSAVIQDTTIDFDIDFVFQPVLFNGKIYFAYLDNQGNYKFTFYDPELNSSGPILNFTSTPVSFLVAESGNIAIIKNGVDATLEIYDADMLSLLDEIPLQFNTGFSAGPIDGAVFDGGVLYYAFPYVQPAQYPSGPAVFDTETQENTLADLFGIAAGVEEEVNEAIGLTVQLYDATQDVFLVGYEVLDQSARGGILQISSDGTLIANVPTTFVPTYFVRN